MPLTTVTAGPTGTTVTAGVVIEGEVIESSAVAVRSKVNALSSLDGQAQGAAVTAMLSHARTGLLAAIAAQDLPQIVEWKAKAGAIHEISKQLQLGKDMQSDAAEFVRRAERGLGVAIREGQANGEVRSNGNQSGSFSTVEKLPGPRDFAKNNELSGGRGGDGIYAMTDGVDEQAFEEAIAEAKAEENLSRANVARKARAKADPKPAPDAKPEPRNGDGWCDPADAFPLAFRIVKKNLESITTNPTPEQAKKIVALLQKTINELRLHGKAVL